jgi:hypothetical protein
MATTLAKVKRNGPTTEAALDALLIARQWGYADDTRRITVMQSDGVTLRRFWDATRLADQTATYGTALIGTQGITGVTPSGGSSGASSTLQAMLDGLATSNGNYIANGTGVQASSNFNISGSGVIGTNLTISSIATGRIPYTTTAGLLTSGTGLTYNGSAFSVTGTGAFSGDFAIATNKFNVTAATGNFSNAGTASIGSNLSAVGDFAINTNKFNITAATGNSSSAGNYALAGRLNIGGATDATNYAINSAAGHIVASGTWGLQAYGVGTPGSANTEYLYINHNGATPFISVDKVGSGSYRGLEIKTGGSTAITVSTTQGVQLASTLGVTGVTTLTGGFTSNATSAVIGPSAGSKFGVGQSTPASLNSRSSVFELSAANDGSVQLPGIVLRANGTAYSTNPAWEMFLSNPSGTTTGFNISSGTNQWLTISNTGAVALPGTLGVTGVTTLSSELNVTGVITAANRSSLGSVYPQSNAVVKVGGTSAITQGGGSTQYGVLLTHSSGTDGSNVLTGLYAVCEATVTCTTVNSINIATNIKAAGTVTDNHGLKIENQTVGTNNWAIKTGTGLIEFGDTVQKATSGEFLIRNTNNTGGSSGGIRLYTSSGDIKLEAAGLVQIVTTGTGLAITGATAITGDLSVATNKFTANATTGNIVSAGNATLKNSINFTHTSNTNEISSISDTGLTISATGWINLQADYVSIYSARFEGNPILSSKTIPASASATGVEGTITWDATYIYICTASNTWKRALASTW